MTDLDLTRPVEGRRLSFEESIALIEDRYGVALDLLGRL